MRVARISPLRTLATTTRSTILIAVSFPFLFCSYNVIWLSLNLFLLASGQRHRQQQQHQHLQQQQLRRQQPQHHHSSATNPRDRWRRLDVDPVTSAAASNMYSSPGDLHEDEIFASAAGLEFFNSEDALPVLPREIPSSELPSTPPQLNAIMDRAMAKVKRLLYELEMDKGKQRGEGLKDLIQSRPPLGVTGQTIFSLPFQVISVFTRRNCFFTPL